MGNGVINEDINNIISADLNWESFERKTILISGANGLLAAYMVETFMRLLQTNKIKNIKIIALVRDKNKAEKRFRDFLRTEHMELLVQDVCDPIIYNGKIDYIIHAASQASPKYYGIDPVGTLNANVLGTNNLLNLARNNDVEGFLYFSSSEVYGELDDDRIPTKECDFGYLNPTDLRSCYAESKRLGETMCISWFKQYGVPIKIVRPFHTYGPGMKLNDGRVFADFVADIVNKRNIVMKSNGSAKRAFCYLADATKGFFTVLLNGENGEPYNIGNDLAEISILDLAEEIVDIFPELKLKVVKMEEDRKINYLTSKITRNCPDIGKAKKIGWEPKINIYDGFKRTIISYDILSDG